MACDKPENVALGAFEKISRAAAGLVEIAHGAERRARRGGAFSDSLKLGLRAREGNRGHCRFASLRDRDDVGDVLGAAKIGNAVSRAGVQQTPGALQKPDCRFPVGDFKYDAA